MDQSNHLLTCKVCDLIYEKPVRLPCDKNICRSHVCGLDGNFIKNYECYFCKISHVVPPKGFYPNFYLKHQVDSFEMKQNLSKSLTDLEDTLNDIENLEKMLKEYFSELRKKIAFQKEFLVKKSKNLSENLSGRVEQLEENYLIDVNEMRLHREEFKSVKLLSETAFQNLKLESDNLNNIGRLNIKDDDYLSCWMKR